MTNYWVFVFREYTDFSGGPIKTLLKRIRRTGKWYIGPHTPHRNHVKKGDKIVIYQAGKKGRRFIGCATVHSDLKVDEKEPFKFVVLSNVSIWKKPVEISSVLDELSFIKNKWWWGAHLQGGISKLPRHDYLRLIRAAANQGSRRDETNVLERQNRRNISKRSVR